MSLSRPVIQPASVFTPTQEAEADLLLALVDSEQSFGEIAERFRPGHADVTYELKYGIRDYRGGGRSSARETAMRVAAGAVARKVLGPDVRIRGALVQVGLAAGLAGRQAQHGHNRIAH